MCRNAPRTSRPRHCILRQASFDAPPQLRQQLWSELYEHLLAGTIGFVNTVSLASAFRLEAPAEFFQGVISAGPLASFQTADTWLSHPYKNGVALLGDAAASSDPSWGNGLALSLRSVRILRDRLLANSDWDAAGNEYAEEFGRVYDVIHNVTNWSRPIFMESGAAADARRERAMPLIAQDPTRVPDHGISGLDMPFDKTHARARFFGEI